MRVDCVKVPIRDHDCVVVLNEEFARYGSEGKNLEYGIVYGSKWILPLYGTSKKQQEASDYVKLLNNELLPEIKEQLYSLYMYYKIYQTLPDPDVNIETIVELMKEDVKAYEELHKTKSIVLSPFEKDETADLVTWTEDDYDEDDLTTDIYSMDDIM